MKQFPVPVQENGVCSQPQPICAAKPGNVKKREAEKFVTGPATVHIVRRSRNKKAAPTRWFPAIIDASDLVSLPELKINPVYRKK